MAYIRTTTVKGHKYLQLVESYRDENGVVQKRVLEHLGPADKISAHVENGRAIVEPKKPKEPTGEPEYKLDEYYEVGGHYKPFKVTANEWQKYGYHRLYYNLYFKNGDTYRLGHRDLETGEFKKSDWSRLGKPVQKIAKKIIEANKTPPPKPSKTRSSKKSKAKKKTGGKSESWKTVARSYKTEYHREAMQTIDRQLKDRGLYKTAKREGINLDALVTRAIEQDWSEDSHPSISTVNKVEEWMSKILYSEVPIPREFLENPESEKWEDRKIVSLG